VSNNESGHDKTVVSALYSVRSGNKQGELETTEW